MNTMTTNTNRKVWIKYSLMIAVALCVVFFAFVTPVSASDDPATPLNVTATVNEPFVTIAWTSTVEAQYALYRSTTGRLEDAVRSNAAQLASISVDSPAIYYSFVDTAASSGVTYTYWIVNKDAVQSAHYGPYTAYVPQKIFFAFLSRP